MQQPLTNSVVLENVCPHHNLKIHAYAHKPRKEFADIFARCKAQGKHMRLEDLIPQNTPVRLPVVYEGINTLWGVRRFKKIFFMDTHHQVYGYNAHVFQRWTGPGYFKVLCQAQESVFDYSQAPSSVPVGFPRVLSNEKGLASWVYGGLVDAMCCVEEGVLIGKVRQSGKEREAYFILVRKGGDASIDGMR
jgi:hypothetical protein